MEFCRFLSIFSSIFRFSVPVGDFNQFMSITGNFVNLSILLSIQVNLCIFLSIMSILFNIRRSLSIFFNFTLSMSITVICVLFSQLLSILSMWWSICNCLLLSNLSISVNFCLYCHLLSRNQCLFCPFNCLSSILIKHCWKFWTVVMNTILGTFSAVSENLSLNTTQASQVGLLPGILEPFCLNFSSRILTEIPGFFVYYK